MEIHISNTPSAHPILTYHRIRVKPQICLFTVYIYLIFSVCHYFPYYVSLLNAFTSCFVNSTFWTSARLDILCSKSTSLKHLLHVHFIGPQRLLITRYMLPLSAVCKLSCTSIVPCPVSTPCISRMHVTCASVALDCITAHLWFMWLSPCQTPSLCG